MDNEAIERNIQFIIVQQAQFAADMQQMQQVFAKSQQRMQHRMDQLTDAVIGLTGIMGRLAEGEEYLLKAQARTDTRIEELAAATDNRINELISLFERHLQEGHDPKSDPPQ